MIKRYNLVDGKLMEDKKGYYIRFNDAILAINYALESVEEKIKEVKDELSEYRIPE